MTLRKFPKLIRMVINKSIFESGSADMVGVSNANNFTTILLYYLCKMISQVRA